MFPNWSGWKTVKIVLFFLGGATGTSGLAGMLPVKYAMIVGTILSTLGILVVALSGSKVGPMLARKALPIIQTVFVLFFLPGCISSSPIVPVTPANQAQVASCQATASLHDDVIIGDFVVGGAGAGMAGVAALEKDTNTKTGLAIGAAIAGAVEMVGVAIAGFTASNFANGNCSSVVGALPMKPLPNDTTTTVTRSP
jgi:hypothetical protein